MNISISLRSEFLKTKRTSSWYLCLLAAAFTPMVSFIDYYEQADISEKIKGNPWSIFFHEGFGLMNILVLPMYVILLCTLLPQIEYRNNTWKQVLASPQPKLSVYLSKYATVLLMILLFLVMHNALSLAVALIIDQLKPAYQFRAHMPDPSLLIRYNLWTFCCILGVSAIQFVAGLRFKNFITPIAIGVCLWVAAGMLTFEWKSPYADIHPFTYPIFMVFEKFESKVPILIAGSAGYAVLFLTLGFVAFRSGKMKG